MKPDRVAQTVAAVEGEGLNTLDRSLVKFVHILRHLGVRVSTAEAMDAFAALAKVDILDRLQVKGALQAALVKSYHDRQVFGRAFDLFFAPPEAKEERSRLRRERQAEKERQEQEAESRLLGEIKESNRPWAKDALERLHLTAEQKETLARIPQQERKRLAELFSRMQGNPVNNPSELIARMIGRSLDYWYHRMLQEPEGQDSNQSSGAAPTGADELDQIIEAVSAGPALEQEDDSILHEDMKNIADRDLPKMAVLIKKLSRRLATRISRRYHRSRKWEKLDVRRTVRRSIRYGGAMLDLRYKARRVQKPRLILICDVSASMARYAAFVAQFIYGLSSVVRGIESFVFAEDLERVTPYFRHGGDFAAVMAGVMGESRQWGQTTNLHAALETFLGSHRRLLQPDAFVIVVSDAKTLAAEDTARDLAEIRRAVREIIWLNTIPQKEWKDVPQAAVFREHCRMFECYTLAHLNRVLRGQMPGA
jgi:hypothetical protein